MQARVQQWHFIIRWATYLNVFVVKYRDEVSDEAVVGEEPLVPAVDIDLEVLRGPVCERPLQLQDKLVLHLPVRALHLAVLPEMGKNTALLYVLRVCIVL